MASAAEEIRDDLIAQEVRYKRIDASVRREVDRRLARLGSDLKDLLIKIDPAGTQRKDARERRLAKLDKESKRLTAEAYSEVNGIMRQNLRKLAKLEAKNTVKTVRKHVP